MNPLNSSLTWQYRTPKTQLLLWVGWMLLLALFIYCWNIMTEHTMWVFVYDAPQAAADLLDRAFPPRWSYMERLW
nr:phosphonate ABC transporter, permease protein PhnE [Vibrio vulnificus]